jgi:importin subunit beta-1
VDKEKVATLSIEFWTSICEVEIERNRLNQQHKNIIMGCSESLVSLAITGLTKNDVVAFEQDLDDDDREWTLSLAAGCFLQHMALVMKDAIIGPVLDFVQPKISSNNPVDKYIGMMAFGAIIDGPD